jgi:RecB family exonuclease
VDYKTGRLPGKKQTQAGGDLQLPIYTEAVQRIFGESCLGGALHHIADNDEALFSILKKWGGSYSITKDFGERREGVLRTIGQLVGGMRDGRFDVLPTHDCPGYCPYRQVCHYAAARAELKAPEDPS